MAEKRASQRVACSNSCQLRFKGKNYRGVIENLSNSGALLKLVARKQLDIPQGSQCSLIIGDDPLFVPGEFSGNVVHHRSSRVGIKFQF
jgi:PilZ domain-containing protein